MRPTLAVAAGAALLFGVLVITAPAALLDSRLAALSGGRLRMANASGTLWNGSGELLFAAAGIRRAVRWQLDALPLLRGEVRVAIANDATGAPSAILTYGRDRFELRNLDFSLPVEDLFHVRAVATAPLRLGGTLRVHVDHMLQLADAVDAQLAVQWDNASVPALRADTRIELGTVRVELDGRGPQLTGPVRNSGGEVEIAGQLALAAAGAATFAATLRTRSTDRARADMIAAMLSTFGTADGHGGYRVIWAGTWR